MIQRDIYLKKLIDAKNNGFPKVITGIRRSGKSYLLSNIFASYLLTHGVNESSILNIDLNSAINFDLRDPLVLSKRILSFCEGKEQVYVFIDEIQKVFTIVNPILTSGKHILAKPTDAETIGFVDVILGLANHKNIDIYVTGSNSKMLSSDIITEFRDKATNIHLAPLSFYEFASYRGEPSSDALTEYLQYGGMPLCVLQEKEKKRDYLKNLFQTTYFKDILDRNRLKRSESLDALCNILSENVGGLINAEKLSNAYRSVTHAKIAKETVERYIDFFADAYLISEARRFDVRGHLEIGATRKYYFTDIGLRNARLNFVFSDYGRVLENVIYNELLFRGFTVNVGALNYFEKDKNGKTVRKTGEIDFLASKDNKKYYIQVAANIDDAKTRQREIKPYSVLNDQVRKIIVVKGNIDERFDENGYTIIGACDFMLRFIA